jgi:hypothetical protein
MLKTKEKASVKTNNGCKSGVTLSKNAITVSMVLLSIDGSDGIW